MAEKLSYSDVAQFCFDCFEITLLDDEYINSAAKMTFIDSEKYKYYLCYNNIQANYKNNQGIRRFDKNNIYTFYNINLWMHDNEFNYICIGGEYISNKDYSIIVKCNKLNHEWETNWLTIWNDSGDCPFCIKQRPTKENNLSDCFKELMNEYDYENNDDPTTYLPYSSKQVYWNCLDCGENYPARISDRTLNNSGCPYCSGRLVSDKNRLSIVRPKLSLEWDYDKNNGLTPNDVSFGFHDHAWWICSECENSWCAEIKSRSSGKGCSKCRQSDGERVISSFLSKNNIDFTPQKTFKNCKYIDLLKFDFYLPDYNLCIEMQGIQHFKPIDFAGRGVDWAEEEFRKNKIKDQIKRDYCRENGINLLEIPYTEFHSIESILQRELSQYVY